MLPLLRDEANSVATIRHVMDRIRDAVRMLNPGQVPVITADQPIFATSKQIKGSGLKAMAKTNLSSCLVDRILRWMHYVFTRFPSSRQWMDSSSYRGRGSFIRHCSFLLISCDCHQNPPSPPGDSVQPLQAPEISLLYICERIGWSNRRQEFWRLMWTPQTTESTIPFLASCADHGVSCFAIHQVSERIQL